MPALSEGEMAVALDPGSENSSDDDGAIPESPLIADINKKKSTSAQNGRSMTTAEPWPEAATHTTRDLTNGANHDDDGGDDEDEEEEDEDEDEDDEEEEEEDDENDQDVHNSQQEEEQDEYSDSNTAPSESASESESESSDEADAPANHSVLKGIEAAAGLAEHSLHDAPDAEHDDDEYEDATSNLDEGDGEDADPSTIATPAGAVEDSDATSGDDDDAADGSCIFCEKIHLDGASTGEDLTCGMCRRPAHLSCARSHHADPDAMSLWACPSCARNQTSTSPNDSQKQRRQSAPRLVRDLLPVSRGMQKPGAHSIFAQPLIPDDEGGRALRKRRSDGDERIPTRDKRLKTDEDMPNPEHVGPELGTRRSSQKLVLGLPPLKPARILQHRPFHKPPPHKFILSFRLDQSKIEAILSEPSRPSRRRYLKKKQKIPPPAPYQPPVPKFPALPAHTLIFPAMFGDRENDTNTKPYGGILSEAEAETSRSLPQMRDREVFEIARKEAEEERKRSSEKAEAVINGLAGEGANAANSKRTVSGPPSKIKCIQFGKHVIDTSYAAPYPEEYSHESRLFICEFCLKYLPSEFVAWRHKLKCPAKHPPGDEIYRDGSLSIWEVDGRKKTEYCQCLCLMAKLFLGSKTLYYDVDPFLFYILTEFDEYGYHFVGYFSKEKRPASQNNVSCILVMPIHQRKGYATFLIEFSYLLTRIEKKEGSPEKPLSDMGLTAYRSYWDLTISRHLLRLGNNPFSVKDIMELTGMTADDVVHSLERLYAFVRDPVTKAYAVRYDKNLYESIVEKFDSKQFRTIKEERLVWTPYIMGRSDAATLDAQPVTAVAQREEDIVKIKSEETEKEDDDVSPKTSHEPAHQSPSKHVIDPALINDSGNIAPGPPSTDAMTGVEPVMMVTDTTAALVNGETPDDKGKAPATSEDDTLVLSGYALIFEKENIPPTRFQIDPPIPPSMIRYAKSKRKSMGSGTPRPHSKTISKPTTPQAIRHSPRKAGSVNGRSSRASTPGKENGSVRRSGRRSGLAHELEIDEDDDVDMEDGMSDVIEVERQAKMALDTKTEPEDDASSSEVGEEDQRGSEDSGSGSEADESDAEEEEPEADEASISADSASSDPDAVVEDDESASASDEEQDDGVELDVPSAVSSAAVSDASVSEASNSEAEEEEEEEEEESEHAEGEDD